MVAVAGNMPSGGVNRVEIAVCSIPALLAMKGHAINGRYKQKDSYDIYYCVRNYPDGIECLAEVCRPLLTHAGAARGFGFIAEKFDRPNGYGPTCVRRFVEETRVLGARTPNQWQQDAFGQVDAWLRALGLKG
jgi:Nucleotidyl transferase AbiEii toxin, Type IV TA system